MHKTKSKQNELSAKYMTYIKYFRL